MFGHQNGFGKVQAFSGVPGVIGTPPGVIGPHGPKVVEEERQKEVARSPPFPNLNWKGKGVRPPFSFLLSTSSFPLLLVGIGKGGKTYLE